MNLPNDWKTYANSVLVQKYQRPAYRNGDMATVKTIAAELRERLIAKGMVKVEPFSWIYKDDLYDGVRCGAIREVAPDEYEIVRYEVVDDITKAAKQFGGTTITKSTNRTKRTVDMTIYREWQKRVYAKQKRLDEL